VSSLDSAYLKSNCADFGKAAESRESARKPTCGNPRVITARRHCKEFNSGQLSAAKSHSFQHCGSSILDQRGMCRIKALRAAPHK
jgi:hypothetical protein